MDDLKTNIFEIKKAAKKNFEDKRIEKYLSVIKKRNGTTECLNTLGYVLLVMGKCLQMMVAYYVNENKKEKVEDQFDWFNTKFEIFSDTFEQIVGQSFRSLIQQRYDHQKTSLISMQRLGLFVQESANERDDFCCQSEVRGLETKGLNESNKTNDKVSLLYINP